MPILVSAHNPMTGPRHLGHFASTMLEWPKLAESNQIIVVIDDLIAALLYPRSADALQHRTIAVVRECLAMDVDFTGAHHHIVLTSMIPEAHEMAFYASLAMDKHWTDALYRESFAGLLSSYQRAELGLPRTPSLAEVAYPQSHLAALTLGLGASIFQGGEEMRGYLDLMTLIADRYDALTAPTFIGRATFVLGIDGQHMAAENAVYVSAPAADIKAQVDAIKSHSILENWAEALGEQSLLKSLHGLQSQGASASLDNAKGQVADMLLRTFEQFTVKRFTSDDIIPVLEKSSAFARTRLQETTAAIKKQLKVTGFAD
jgi:tryptophanyl-tRNA synthetase